MTYCQTLYNSNLEVRKEVNKIEKLLNELSDDAFMDVIESIWTEKAEIIAKELNIQADYLRIWLEVDDLYE
jgi:hypothetical protein